MDTLNEKQVRILKEIPPELFTAAREEVLRINWSNLPLIDNRSKRAIFKSSSTINLRVHKLGKDSPDTYQTNANVIDCIDTVARTLYPQLERTIRWIYNEVAGFQLGRIMLVKLQSGGSVPSHVDAGDYFQFHYRFHLPLLTDQKVVFTGPENNQKIHMPEGYLCQLLNTNPHGEENNSSIDRIHLILDIASRDSMFSYDKLKL